jgi:hypothetical protein
MASSTQLGAFVRRLRIPAKPGRHSDSCRATIPVHAGPVSEAVSILSFG